MRADISENHPHLYFLGIPLFKSGDTLEDNVRLRIFHSHAPAFASLQRIPIRLICKAVCTNKRTTKKAVETASLITEE